MMSYIDLPTGGNFYGRMRFLYVQSMNTPLLMDKTVDLDSMQLNDYFMIL